MLKNNKFSADTDAERWERLDLLATNIGTYAAELGVAGAKLQWAQDACSAWETARTTAGVELGEKEEAFQEFHKKLDELAKYYTSAKELLLAVIYEYEKPDEIVEAYHIEGESPRDLKRLVARVDWWQETHTRLKAAGDPRIVADAIVTQLVQLRNDTKGLWEFAITQKREKLDAFDQKEELFTQDCKSLSWLLGVCKLVWGYDDERMLELGLVPKSQIWTPGKEKIPAPKMLLYDEMRTSFTWLTVPEAEKYELEVKNVATGETTTYESVRNYKYIELAKGDYTAKVRAVKESSPAEYSDWSTEIAFGIIYGAPENLRYNVAQDEFRWNNVPGTVMYVLACEGVGEIYAGPDTFCIYDFTGEHRFRVRAGDDDNKWGQWSAWLTVNV